MRFYNHLLAAAALSTILGCEKDSGVDRMDGVKDALDARPNEEIRDFGENIGDAVKDAGRDIKDAINDK